MGRLGAPIRNGDEIRRVEAAALALAHLGTTAARAPIEAALKTAQGRNNSFLKESLEILAEHPGGIPSLADYVDAYVARTGLDPRPYLAVYSAYNFFRLAAILQGIVGRVRDGTATNENAPARAQMVRPLAETAWEFAREAGA